MVPTDRPRSEPGTQIADLYADYGGALRAHLRRLVNDQEAAEDLCQETFIKALRNWERRDPQASVAAWLYRIATNTAYDYLRRRQRIRFMSLQDSPGFDIPSNNGSQIDEQEPVRLALAQLPPMYRLPLIMHTCDGRSTQEIARALGCSNSAVKTRLFRARERFREVYQS